MGSQRIEHDFDLHLSGKGIFLRNVLELLDTIKTKPNIPKGDGEYALPLSSPPICHHAYCFYSCVSLLGK